METTITEKQTLLLQLFNEDPLKVSQAYQKLLELNNDTNKIESLEQQIEQLKNENELLEKELEQYKGKKLKPENKWCIYKHTNKINGKVYIGITSDNLNGRWGNGNGYKYNEVFYSDIKKYGWTDGFYHIVLEDNLCKQDAEYLEKENIKKYNSTDKNYGYNIAKGGNICSTNAISVYQYDLEGNFVNEYNSYADAGRRSGIAEWMIRSCISGKRKTTGIYQWSLTRVPKMNKIENQDSSKRLQKVVYQYDLDGNYISSYKNPMDAKIKTGVDNRHITRCCNKESISRAGNYQWFYEYKGEKIDPYISCSPDKRKKTPTIMYDKEMNYIKEYESLQQAVDDLWASFNIKATPGGIRNCIRGANKTAYGFIFKRKYN